MTPPSLILILPGPPPNLWHISICVWFFRYCCWCSFFRLLSSLWKGVGNVRTNITQLKKVLFILFYLKSAVSNLGYVRNLNGYIIFQSVSGLQWKCYKLLTWHNLLLRVTRVIFILIGAKKVGNRCFNSNVNFYLILSLFSVLEERFKKKVLKTILFKVIEYLKFLVFFTFSK